MRIALCPMRTLVQNSADRPPPGFSPGFGSSAALGGFSMRSAVWLVLGLGFLSLTLGACARVAPLADVMGGSGGGGGSGPRPGTDGGIRPDRGPTNIPMQCGDGVRTQDEAC